MTEAQKTSDRFYEFFYNRYYYDRIKKMIILPTFLTIDNNDYKELVDYVKKIDRNLVSLVKKSKF